MRRMWKGVLVSLLSGSLFCVGCGQQSVIEEQEKCVVGVVTKSDSSEFWMSVSSGMEAAAEQFNMTVVLMSPNSELDLDVQKKQVERLIDQQVDVLAISPIDSNAAPAFLDELKKKNITAVAFDTAFENASIPYIGINNYEIGYELARTLAKELLHEGHVGIIAGDLRQSGHKERVDGFRDYMKTEPRMTVEFVESGYANMQMSEQKVRELIDQHPNVEGIISTSAVTAIGLVDVLRGTDIKIVAVDEQEDALTALEKGEITALAAQSGYQIGYETIRYISRLQRNPNLTKKYELDVPILTKENIKEYRSNNEKK